MRLDGKDRKRMAGASLSSIVVLLVFVCLHGCTCVHRCVCTCAHGCECMCVHVHMEVRETPQTLFLRHSLPFFFSLSRWGQLTSELQGSCHLCHLCFPECHQKTALPTFFFFFGMGVGMKHRSSCLHGKGPCQLRQLPKPTTDIC